MLLIKTLKMFLNRYKTRTLVHDFYLLEKIVMNVSASFDVKMGSGSSLKYCFSMSAMS